MFRKVSIVALLALAGANAQVAKKVVNVPLCGSPQGSLSSIAAPGLTTAILNGLVGAGVAAGTLFSPIGARAGTYIGNLAAGACPAPAAVPAGTIGHWMATCSSDILQPVIVRIADANPVDSATLAGLCGAAAVTVPTGVTTGATAARCAGEVAVTSNTPKKKFPGSTEFFDFTPAALTYALVGGFSDGAAGVARGIYCVFAPNTITATALPAGGTGKWAKSYVNDIAIAGALVAPAAPVATRFPLGVGAEVPALAALAAGPLARQQYAFTTTVNYWKSYLPVTAL